jgi:hypothetical protein
MSRDKREPMENPVARKPIIARRIARWRRIVAGLSTLALTAGLLGACGNDHDPRARSTAPSAKIVHAPRRPDVPVAPDYDGSALRCDGFTRPSGAIEVKVVACDQRDIDDLFIKSKPRPRVVIRDSPGTQTGSDAPAVATRPSVSLVRKLRIVAERTSLVRVYVARQLANDYLYEASFPAVRLHPGEEVALRMVGTRLWRLVDRDGRVLASTFVRRSGPRFRVDEPGPAAPTPVRLKATWSGEDLIVTWALHGSPKGARVDVYGLMAPELTAGYLLVKDVSARLMRVSIPRARIRQPYLAVVALRGDSAKTAARAIAVPRR